jgi:hypothetical protein
MRNQTCEHAKTNLRNQRLNGWDVFASYHPFREFKRFSQDTFSHIKYLLHKTIL